MRTIDLFSYDELVNMRNSLPNIFLMKYSNDPLIIEAFYHQNYPVVYFMKIRDKMGRSKGIHIPQNFELQNFSHTFVV